jgi:hypothetical protein
MSDEQKEVPLIAELNLPDDAHEAVAIMMHLMTHLRREINPLKVTGCFIGAVGDADRFLSRICPAWDQFKKEIKEETQEEHHEREH